MKKLIILSVSCFLLVGIVFYFFVVRGRQPQFIPKTGAGASCKKDCATQLTRCDVSPYSCDNGYGRCIEACADQERIGIPNE